MPSSNRTPKPIPVGGPAVLVAAVALLIGGVALIPFAVERVKSSRTPPTNNLSKLDIAPRRQVPVPPAEVPVHAGARSAARLRIV